MLARAVRITITQILCNILAHFYALYKPLVNMEVKIGDTDFCTEKPGRGRCRTVRAALFVVHRCSHIEFFSLLGLFDRL